jgi:hypothetical protein
VSAREDEAVVVVGIAQQAALSWVIMTIDGRNVPDEYNHKSVHSMILSLEGTDPSSQNPIASPQEPYCGA